MDIVSLVGITGLVMLLLSFLLQTSGIFDSKKIGLQMLNFLGASGLAYYSFAIQNPYFTILETVWSLGALISLLKVCKQSRKS
jgi:hypothetical protein